MFSFISSIASSFQKRTVINKDAFASGQISSKIWLCEKIEPLISQRPVELHILAGWYGVLAFLLFSRGKLNIKEVHIYDTDTKALNVARKLLENWIWLGIPINFQQKDITSLKIKKSDLQQLIVNTSIEHVKTSLWWSCVPKEAIVALQACNMEHPEHVNRVQHEDELTTQFSCSRILYKGQLNFDYPENPFSRFMLIGVK